MASEITPSPESGTIDSANLCFSVAESAPHPMAMVQGANHTLRYANAAFCQLIDKSKDELVGKLFSEVLEKNDQCLTLLDRVSRTGMPASHMEEEHSRTHPLFWSYTLWPVMVDKRALGTMMLVTETAHLHEKTLAMNEALILGSVRQHELTEAADESNALLQVEITDRKQAGETLQLAKEQLTDRASHLEDLVNERTAELIATNKQMEAFVYSIAHDLRAPLRAMQGFSTVLEEEAEGLDETGKDYAHRINKAAQFMDAMLIDLLAFSSISQQRVELISVNLKTVIESLLSRLEKDIHDKRARVEISGPWSSVLAHEPTLAQVIFNLISNALKFVEPDVPPVVLLRSEQKEEIVRVWIEDNGLGIAPDHHEQVFQIFTRLEGAKYGGTGIGLAIVQKGVERMGGRAGVQSILGQGSRFWIELRHAPII